MDKCRSKLDLLAPDRDECSPVIMGHEYSDQNHYFRESVDKLDSSISSNSWANQRLDLVNHPIDQLLLSAGKSDPELTDGNMTVN